MMNLLYITVGSNISIHLEAAFSIYSFLGRRIEMLTINIITDAPAFYNHLNDRVKVVTVDENTLRNWKGEHDFFWRIKIKGIEMMCNLYAGSPVIYLDADTFLYGRPDELVKTLAGNKALMHEQELALCKGKSKTEKRMWNGVGNTCFAGIKILPTHYMWNAGVVAIPNTKNGDECRLALAICDEMCGRQITRRLIEQFALSVALSEHYGIKSAKGCIAHYWSNKQEWDEQIAHFFMASCFKGYSFEQNIELIRNYNFTNTPVQKKKRSIKRRMEHLVDKLFPPKDICYIKD